MPHAKRVVALWAGMLIACGGGERRPAMEVTAGSLTIADAGLRTPESVLYEESDDVYLVSNINGSPLEKDGNGFISKFSPDGAVQALKWIDGATPGVELNAPKGMTLKGDTLFVADIDAVRAFNRHTGAPLGSRLISGATFLNDMATGPDGTVYVTDSGLQAGAQGFDPSGSDAVYSFGANGLPVALVRGPTLGNPNGILAEQDTLTVVTFGTGEIVMLDPKTGKEVGRLSKPPGGQLDGVARAADHTLLVSSWEGKAVYRYADGQYSAVVDSVEAPADIGYDTKRQRVLVPLFNASRIEGRTVGR